jgi:hypothetical protein
VSEADLCCPTVRAALVDGVTVSVAARKAARVLAAAVDGSTVSDAVAVWLAPVLSRWRTATG